MRGHTLPVPVPARYKIHEMRRSAYHKASLFMFELVSIPSASHLPVPVGNLYKASFIYKYIIVNSVDFPSLRRPSLHGPLVTK